MISITYTIEIEMTGLKSRAEAEEILDKLKDTCAIKNDMRATIKETIHINPSAGAVPVPVTMASTVRLA